MSIAMTALTGMLAANRLSDVPGSDAFRTNLVISGLFCGNPVAQMAFNIRAADDIAEMLADRERLRGQVAAQRLVVLSAPAVTGTAEIGKELKAAAGSYSGTAAPRLKGRQWLLNSTPVSGATGETYVVRRGDAGHTLAVQETLQSELGEVAITSTGIAVPGPVVAAAGAAAQPADAPPGIAVKAQAGAMLEAQPGTFTGERQGRNRAYQWMRGDQPIPGETNRTYTVVADDAGKSLRVKETAEIGDQGEEKTLASNPVNIP
ncbi:hypothetical protein ACFOD4_20505 [Pseudoroseomonas globiformis]|uniref:Uncharacterized protein n=1 Tax=Teichococcus globiformis TaxID=2307229 RepID=A0ABV7G6F6_9PROT